jgi:molybdopterin converting factor subunit 1
VKIELLYFAQLRDATGSEREELELDPGATVDDAVDLLRRRPEWAAVEGLPLTFAVNEEVVASNRELREGDCLALLPPVSGG